MGLRHGEVKLRDKYAIHPFMYTPLVCQHTQALSLSRSACTLACMPTNTHTHTSECRRFYRGNREQRVIVSFQSLSESAPCSTLSPCLSLSLTHTLSLSYSPFPHSTDRSQRSATTHAGHIHNKYSHINTYTLCQTAVPNAECTHAQADIRTHALPLHLSGPSVVKSNQQP